MRLAEARLDDVDADLEREIDRRAERVHRERVQAAPPRASRRRVAAREVVGDRPRFHDALPAELHRTELLEQTIRHGEILPLRAHRATCARPPRCSPRRRAPRRPRRRRSPGCRRPRTTSVSSSADLSDPRGRAARPRRTPPPTATPAGRGRRSRARRRSTRGSGSSSRVSTEPPQPEFSTGRRLPAKLPVRRQHDVAGAPREPSATNDSVSDVFTKATCSGVAPTSRAHAARTSARSFQYGARSRSSRSPRREARSHPRPGRERRHAGVIEKQALRDREERSGPVIRSSRRKPPHPATASTT